MALTDEIAVKLGISTAEFKSALKDAGASMDDFKSKGERGATTVDGLFEKLGHKVLGVRDVSHAVATALGLNIEKIAESIAHAISGVSKADEEAYKTLGGLSDRATDLVIKNMRARLTEEQKLTLLIQDRDRLQKKLDEGSFKTAEQQVEQQKLRIELENKVGEIFEAESRQKEKAAKAEAELNRQYLDQAKQRADLAEKEFQSRLASLTPHQRIAELTKDIALQQQLIASGLAKGANEERVIAQISQDRNAVLAEEVKMRQEDVRYLKESGDIDEKLKKIAFEKLDPEQQIATLQKERARLQKEIKNDATDENQVKKDKVKVSEIDKQIAETQLKVEEATTAEIKKQTEEENKKVEAAKMFVSVSHTGQYEAKDLTDRQLNEKIQQLQKQQADDMVQRSKGNIVYTDTQELDRAQAEKKLREDFLRSANTIGEERALQQFSAFDEDRLRALFEGQNVAKDTLASIKDLQQHIAQAFPLR